MNTDSQKNLRYEIKTIKDVIALKKKNGHDTRFEEDLLASREKLLNENPTTVSHKPPNRKIGQVKGKVGEKVKPRKKQQVLQPKKGQGVLL